MMGRFAIIEDGVVANIVVAAAGVAAEHGWIAATNGVQIGWTHDGSAFAAPVVSLEDAKAAATARVAAKRDAILQAGFTPVSGPLAGHTLQTRNLDDRTNWLVSQAAYSAAVAVGGGDILGASFRTAANETIDTTYAAGLTALLSLAAWGADVMGRSWALKDLIAAAADQAALDAIDIEAGWP